jgi:hypothetical protein
MKNFVDDLKFFIYQTLALLNLVISVCCLISYTFTMEMLVYWTSWKDSAGAYGGFLDYRFLGISTIFHVTNQNLQGRVLFLLPDITSYLFVALIIINLAASRGRWEAQAYGFGELGGFYTNLILGSLSILAYVWGTMMPIAGLLKPAHLSPGGILQYRFPWGYAVYHVNSGSLESMGLGFGLDFTSWLLIIMIILDIVVAANVHRKKSQR